MQIFIYVIFIIVVSRKNKSPGTSFFQELVVYFIYGFLREICFKNNYFSVALYYNWVGLTDSTYRLCLVKYTADFLNPTIGLTKLTRAQDISGDVIFLEQAAQILTLVLR